MSFHVVITDCPWEDNSIEHRILEDGGAEVQRAQCTTPEEVIAAARGADALLVGWAPINADVIASLSNCKLLMRYGTGYNNIDVVAATRAGMAVAINAEYCVDEVATHALAMLLACHRQLSVLMNAVRQGVWQPMEVMRPMPVLSRQTLGIVGLGRIGRRLAEMARPLVDRVAGFDPVLPADKAPYSVEMMALPDLLRQADYISIHAPLNAATERLFGAANLALMKKSAYLINCARGPIVDEDALVSALESGALGGAALDVFTTEPLPADHPLREFPNVIITPHAAWYSEDADYHLRANPAEAIVRFFRGEPIPLINRPHPRGTAALH